MSQSHSVGEILDCLEAVAGQRERVPVGTIVESLGNRGYGAVLMLPALVDWSPIGGVPGVQSFLALMSAIVAAQMMFGRSHLWLPGFVARRCIDSDSLCHASERLRGVARFMDRHFHGRYERLTRAPFSRIAAAVVIVICLAVPPLDLIPFGGSGPMLAISMFGLALLVRDGLLMIVALALSAGAVGLGLSLWRGFPFGGD